MWRKIFSHPWLAPALILLLAVAVRFYQLGSVPIELNRDEASLGYTAYSILYSGHEEHGVRWPVQIESFGDWKLPGYVYTLIPFIKVFGLTMWSTRLPSALAGVSVVISSFFLMRLLVSKTPSQRWMELGVPLLLAVSPWQVHFSHVAYEAHLALALFLWGLVALLAVLRDFTLKKQRRPRLLVFSQVLWAVTLLTYHSYQVFIPAFMLCVVWVYRAAWKRFFAKRSMQLGVASLPLICVLALLLGSGAGQANRVKFSALSIFNLNAYTKVVDDTRTAFPNLENPLFVLSANKLSAFAQQAQVNFFRLISPEFLFLQGGANHGHNITGFGNLYPLVFFGLVVGLAAIVIERKQWQLLVGAWLLSASIAPMITFEANHTTRFSPGFTALEILSVYGFFLLARAVRKYCSKRIYRVILSVVAIGLFYSMYRFLVHYYFLFPNRDLQYWPWQMKSLVYYVEGVKEQYDAVYFQDEKYSPYIYFLFYEPTDPKSLHERLEYYPVDAEGFHHVRRLDTIYFQRIDWQNDALYAGKKVLIVVEEQQIPDFNRQQPGTNLLMTVKNEWAPRGVDIWEYQGKPSEQ